MNRSKDITISKEETDRKNIIEGAFKTIVHDRNVLAFIIKNTVDECKDADLETIREGIAHEKDSDLAKGREQDLVVYPSRIELDSSFDLTIEGTEISVIINLEAQNEYDPKYPLENRATFYASCVMASQKGNEMLNDHYEQLRPVYSIWVLPNPPMELRNTVKTYAITETTDIGGRPFKSLINIVFLNIGFYDGVSNPAVDLFSVLMGRYNGESDTREKLKKCFNLIVSDAVIGGAKTMTTLAEQSENVGYKRGKMETEESRLTIEAESTVSGILSMSEKYGKPLAEVIEDYGIRDDLRPYFDRELERRLAERRKDPNRPHPGFRVNTTETIISCRRRLIVMSPRTERPLGGRIRSGRLSAAFFVLAVAAVCLMIGSGDDSSAQSGTCGDSVSWSYDGGTLAITGTGAMENYEDPDDQPWGIFRGDITSIAVGEGVTSIGKYAFCSCGAASVTLPASLASIGPSSFRWCDNLKTISLPQGLTNIGDNAFRSSGLTSVTIPNGVTAIRSETFWTCVGLKTVIIPDSVTSIDFEAFSHCAFIKEMYVSNSLITLGENAFDDVTLYDSDASTELEKDVEHLRGAMFVNRSGMPVKLATDIIGNGSVCSKASDTHSASLTLDDVTYVKNKADFDSDTVLQFLLKDGIKAVFDSKVINTLGEAAIELTVMPVDKSTLSEAVRELIGDNPAYSVSFGGYNELGEGKATITVPYTVSGDIVKASFVKGESVASTVTCTYADGKATFDTNDLSMFFVSSEKSSGGGSDSPVWIPIIIAVVILAAVGAAAAFFFLKRERL